MNGKEVLYIVVVDEPIADFQKIIVLNSSYEQYKNDLDSYSKVLLDMFIKATGDAKITDQRQSVINGLPAALYSFDVFLLGHEVKY